MVILVCAWQGVAERRLDRYLQRGPEAWMTSAGYSGGKAAKGKGKGKGAGKAAKGKWRSPAGRSARLFKFMFVPPPPTHALLPPGCQPAPF